MERDMDLQALVDELRERVAKLEAAKSHRRSYNQQQAAQELGMSVTKLREEQRANRIKGVLNGRVWVFTSIELDRYLASGNEGSAA
jgi:hypothetical protein